MHVTETSCKAAHEVRKGLKWRVPGQIPHYPPKVAKGLLIRDYHDSNGVPRGLRPTNIKEDAIGRYREINNLRGVFNRAVCEFFPLP